MTKPRIGVVYERGAAGPSEIVACLSPFADVVLLAPPTEHTRRMASFLRRLPCEVMAIDPAALDMGALPRLDGVVTFADSQVLTTALVAEATGLPGHPVEVARVLTEKAAQRRRLREEGVDDVKSLPVTEEATLERAVAQIGMPVIVKPLRGEGSVFTARADTLDQARTAARQVWDAEPGRVLVVEELLHGVPCGAFGEQVSVEIASVAGDHRVLAVTGKFRLAPPFRERGSFWPSALDPELECQVEELAIRAAAAVGVVDGVGHVEVKLTASGPRVIEVNGRVGGLMAELAERSTGYDLLAAAGRIALGLPVERPRIRPERIIYHRQHLAPLWARRVDVVEGVQQVRGLPFADSYRLLVPMGSDLRADKSTEPLDILCATAATHEEMLDQISTAQRHLTFTFTDEHCAEHTVPALRIDELLDHA